MTYNNNNNNNNIVICKAHKVSNNAESEAPAVLMCMKCHMALAEKTRCKDCEHSTVPTITSDTCHSSKTP